MSSATAEPVEVEVAYARPDAQLIIAVRSIAGATVEQVILQSDILRRFPEIDLTQNKVGVFGRPCALTTRVRTGDRIEIYRGLIADPKEVRRQRAAQGKPMRGGGRAETGED